jgi:hypothetical protein
MGSFFQTTITKTKKNAANPALASQRAGIDRFRITVVGDGHERGWLESNVPKVAGECRPG